MAEEIFNPPNPTLLLLKQIDQKLDTLLKETQMAGQDVTDLTTAVNNLTSAVGQNTTEVGAAITEIGTLLTQIQANSSDPAAVESLVTQINTQISAIGQSNQTLAAALPSSNKK